MSEHFTSFAIVWRTDMRGPFLLDVDGDDAERLATHIGRNLAEAGASQVTIIEHSAPIDEGLLAAGRVRFKRTLDSLHIERLAREIAR